MSMATCSKCLGMSVLQESYYNIRCDYRSPVVQEAPSIYSRGLRCHLNNVAFETVHILRTTTTCEQPCSK